MTSITLSGVNKSFGANFPVISGVDLKIDDGEFCVFLGPSGCGKSTLLRMVAGLETAYSGEIRIGDRVVDKVEPADREVAMVFQNYALYPHMSVYDNMAFGLRQAKTPKDEIDRRVREAARILQIEPLLDRMPKALSGGQRQRVAIGRAIVRQPKVFLFDEPLSNLDAALRVHMRSEIATLHRNFPAASMIYVTHDQTEAMALADKIVLLHAGKDMLKHGSIAQVGKPLDLYHRPRNLFVAGFLGSPTMNFIEASFAGQQADGARVALKSGEEIVVPVDGSTLAAGAAVTLGVRPEHLAPVAASGAALGAQTLTRRVSAVEHFGEYSFVYLDGGTPAPLIAKVAGDGGFKAGDSASFAAPADCCHLFDADGIALSHL
ncbi:ABC transporter ATP-binding protein [Pleomorphomonas carboxyditropha]|uniref:ABC transporter n=1 Tax=Pleomorphomonas carboxyditropha TaxID=2023338 RepID=A0A2G9WRE1_9HYPH|nr:sn-glycerol-3-phosphate ABC transporter ATP-binding protein UgpC [Pleomorphomonas carboxyditropha]PIO97287.1 ABC transporter [Pleomorphomonas carboxyditropha]